MGRVSLPRPGPRDVLVWTAPRSWPLPPHCAQWLDDIEQTRAATMPPAERETFVLARALLRGALGAVLGADPGHVTLTAACPCGRPHGRVRVGSGPRGRRSLHVSVTRTGPLVAVAVAARPVGVDVTSVATASRAPLVDVALGPGEAAWWAGDVVDRPFALAQAWARKEAVLKAVGTGLDLAPSAVDVRGPLTRVALDGRTTTVRIVDLPVRAGQAGAVAVVAAGRDPRSRAAVRLEVHDGAVVLGGG